MPRSREKIGEAAWDVLLHESDVMPDDFYKVVQGLENVHDVSIRARPGTSKNTIRMRFEEKSVTVPSDVTEGNRDAIRSFVGEYLSSIGKRTGLDLTGDYAPSTSFFNARLAITIHYRNMWITFDMPKRKQIY